MAEMLIQRESLTPIADQVRVLSGTSDSMSLGAMNTNLNEANTEIDSQTELLAQAIAALEGKASGGGGQNLPYVTGVVTVDTSSSFTIPELAGYYNVMLYEFNMVSSRGIEEADPYPIGFFYYGECAYWIVYDASAPAAYFDSASYNPSTGEMLTGHVYGKQTTFIYVGY